MKTRIKEFLNTNYPVDFSNNWKSVIFAAVFISLVFSAFEPFGLSNLNIANKKLILAYKKRLPKMFFSEGTIRETSKLS